MPKLASSIEWDDDKDGANSAKHSVSFALAQLAFLDPQRVILQDTVHSDVAPRFYCLGIVAEGIMTVRFTYRKNVIRIFGAGYWRKGRKIYEQENHIH